MELIRFDDAATMTEHRIDVVALMKQVAPHVISRHCAIRKYTLSCQTLPIELKSVLDHVVKSVNFVGGRAANCQFFKAFYDNLTYKYQYLLFHFEVR